MTTAHAGSVATSDLVGVAGWFKSTYSGNGNNCVETADLTATSYDAVAVRDSKLPDGAALLVSIHAFAAFTSTLKTNPAGH
ncbi:DUF397 domain-containing protein [Streptomyces sp. AJS327]|uniref:DUF397 domain-containing protein n=1 Tax=Streptomyces sp. AJS327 TaxID=2545265 RepID=UPI0015DF7DB0|nr:DUF397 domain-containing protein [Streptomyces sp. AJS327]MBA0053015.1 DUF397 domain-containing protein [Streptomyces sp. AJS327]